MKLSVKRAVAVTIPGVLLAGSIVTADAASFHGPTFYRNIGVRPFTTGPAVLGGGATLPIPAYLGKSVSGAYEATGSTSFGVTGSIFGYFGSQTGGLNVEYCATGSGKGKGVFDGVANTVDIACSNAASKTATTFGFLPPSGTPRQTYPTLAGTDAPLVQTDYNSYIADHASGEPVELPSVFGSVSIIYHDNFLSSSAARITLTNQQICQIYTGVLKTFSQIDGNSKDTTPIVPIYRSDGSGTSFNFSNHLASAPGASACTGFGANQTFTSADPFALPAANGYSGNSGVIGGVNATNGGIGYVETGYLADLPTGTGPSNYANVVNPTTGTAVDPFAGLPAAASAVAESTLQTNVVVNQTVAGGGRATTSAISGVKGSCVKVVPPSAYANPKTGYPIVAVTYVLFNSAGNGTADTALRLLEKDLTTPSLFKHPGATTPITTVDEAEPAVTSGTTGYSSLGSTFSSTIQATANACIGA